jgi:hypothetical protein
MRSVKSKGSVGVVVSGAALEEEEGEDSAGEELPRLSFLEGLESSLEPRSFLRRCREVVKGREGAVGKRRGAAVVVAASLAVLLGG